jgi:lipopolysaccharide transport system permease protein
MASIGQPLGSADAVGVRRLGARATRRDTAHLLRVVQALAVREFKGRYRRSMIGPMWAVIQPLFYMGTFILVGNILRISSGGVPYALFTFSALVPWTFFANAVSRCAPCVYVNAGLVKKIALPREVFPIAQILESYIDLVISSLILTALMFWFHTGVGWSLLWVPLVLLLVSLLAVGVGLEVAAIGTYQFDTVFALPFVMQLWLLGTPVMYALASVPPHWLWLYRLNPMVGIVDAFRRSVVLGVAPDLGLLACSAAVIGVVWLIAWPSFRFMSQYFADVL